MGEYFRVGGSCQKKKLCWYLVVPLSSMMKVIQDFEDFKLCDYSLILVRCEFEKWSFVRGVGGDASIIEVEFIDRDVKSLRFFGHVPCEVEMLRQCSSQCREVAFCLLAQWPFPLAERILRPPRFYHAAVICFYGEEVF